MSERARHTEGAANLARSVAFQPQDDDLVWVAREDLAAPGVAAGAVNGRGDAGGQIEITTIVGKSAVMVTFDKEVANWLKPCSATRFDP